MNYYALRASADERAFARAAAAHAECELIERERNPRVNFADIQSIRRTCSPRLDLCGFDYHRWEVDLARERGATAIFWGALGDALFQRGPASWAAGEYIWRHGFRPELARVAMDVAQFERVSVWTVLADAVQIGAINPPKKNWNPYTIKHALYNAQTPEKRLMSADAKDAFERELDRFIHPWFRSVRRVPPGKLWTISSLTLETDYDAPFMRLGDPPKIGPLPSQPIVEACLRIPSHLNFDGGWDRAVARRAFANDLPDKVRRRTTKGRPTSWMRDASIANSKFLREFLLDGELVRAGLLDRQKVSAALSGVASKSELPNFAIVIDHLYTEAWLRLWSDRKYQAAA